MILSNAESQWMVFDLDAKAAVSLAVVSSRHTVERIPITVRATVYLI